MTTRRPDPRALPVPPAWQTLIEEWMIAQQAAGHSPATIATRRDHLQRTARALGGSPWTTTADQLVDWCGRQTWARETRRSVYGSLRSFWAWAIQTGRADTSPAARLPRIRAVDPCPRPAPDDVLTGALDGVDRRVRLILRLAAEAGLRRGEIAQVHAADLTRDLLGWSLLVHGKGGKDRLVPLPDSLADELRLTCRHSWAFPGEMGGHLSPRWVGKLAAAALPGQWTLHTLRHRFATRAFDGSGDLLAVQQLLGHASPATTQRYVARSTAALRRAAGFAA